MSNINKRSLRCLLMALFASLMILGLTGGTKAYAAPSGFTSNSWGYRYTGYSSFVQIPKEITTVNSFMFDENYYVQGIYVPSHVTAVDSYAFYKCKNLKFIWFESYATSVHRYAMIGLTGLVNVAAPTRSSAYSRCIADRVPVVTTAAPCFKKSTVYLLPSDSLSMPLYNSFNTSYSSSNTKVVTVDQNGNIKAKKKGKATITATLGSRSFKYKVVVYKKKQSNRPKQVKQQEGLSKSVSKFQKIKAVHDWMIKNVKYDYPKYLKGRLPRVAHTAQGSLIKKLCVCDGYALGFKKIMKSLKIPCRVVYGKGNGGGHAWNMVKLGGKWYHIDVTWDDPILTGGNYGNTTCYYDYFLKSTSYMKKHGHSFKTSRYPKCKSTLYDNNGLSFGRNIRDEVVGYW